MAPEMPRRKPVPPPSGLRPGWERELTERFRQLLSTKRMNTLNNRRLTRTASTASQQSSTGSRPPHQEPLPLRHGSGINPARSATPLDSFPLGAPQQQARIPSLSNIPIMATKYTDRSHQRFRNQLHALSETPLKWENPGLLDEAMRQLPMETLFARATEEENYFKASAASLGSGKKPAWSFQDCLIRAMMKWFKKDFFTFVNVPKCCRCGGNTMPVDNGTGSGIMQMAPNAEEQALSATKVELYHCPRVECGAHTRFARYSDAFVLMRMKKGRAGEWVNTFAMLCRALGARVRWVWVSWDNGDHSWAEVYSEYRKRWVHVDPCEASWDHPEMYCEGWGRKIRYCLAFSSDSAIDVTSRYCRNPHKYGGSRNKVPESVLLYILSEIRSARRRNLSKDQKFKLEGEESFENRELRHYYVEALMKDVLKIVPNKQKTEEQRREEEADRRKAEERALEGVIARERTGSQEGRTTPSRRAPDMPPPGGNPPAR